MFDNQAEGILFTNNNPFGNFNQLTRLVVIKYKVFLSKVRKGKGHCNKL